MGVGDVHPEEPRKDGNRNLGGYVEGVGNLVRQNAYQHRFKGWKFEERMESERERMMKLGNSWFYYVCAAPQSISQIRPTKATTRGLPLSLFWVFSPLDRLRSSTSPASKNIPSWYFNEW